MSDQPIKKKTVTKQSFGCIICGTGVHDFGFGVMPVMYDVRDGDRLLTVCYEHYDQMDVDWTSPDFEVEPGYWVAQRRGAGGALGEREPVLVNEDRTVTVLKRKSLQKLEYFEFISRLDLATL